MESFSGGGSTAGARPEFFGDCEAMLEQRKGDFGVSARRRRVTLDVQEHRPCESQ